MIWTDDMPFEFEVGDTVAYTEDIRLVKKCIDADGNWHEKWTGYDTNHVIAMVVAVGYNNECLLDNGITIERGCFDNGMYGVWGGWYTDGRCGVWNDDVI